MPTTTKTKRPARKRTSKRELIEPKKGDRRYVRRKSDGTFRKMVDVVRSLFTHCRMKGEEEGSEGSGRPG